MQAYWRKRGEKRRELFRQRSLEHSAQKRMRLEEDSAAETADSDSDHQGDDEAEG